MTFWKRRHDRQPSRSIWIDAPKNVFEQEVPVSLEGIDPVGGDADLRTLRSRLGRAAVEYLTVTHTPGLSVTVRAGVDAEQEPSGPATEAPARVLERDADTKHEHDRRAQFIPVPPRPGLDLLVLPPDTRERLLSAVSVLAVGDRVFETWNLKSIEPYPLSAINLYGPPGTGKTLAAHGIAHYLGKPLLAVKTSQLESMFHGEGAKNVEAVFSVAREHDAVLFVDEADSLLSRRIASPIQGSEHAVNTMRSELFLSLDAYSGIVLFATNLIEAYDPAFESRVMHIGFSLPDRVSRAEIWRRHLPRELPLAEDVSIAGLAALDGLSGRDIKRAIVSSAVDVARRGLTEVHHRDLITAARLSVASPASGNDQGAVDAMPADASDLVRQAITGREVPFLDDTDAVAEQATGRDRSSDLDIAGGTGSRLH